MEEISRRHRKYKGARGDQGEGTLTRNSDVEVRVGITFVIVYVVGNVLHLRRRREGHILQSFEHRDSIENNEHVKF